MRTFFCLLVIGFLCLSPAARAETFPPSSYPLYPGIDVSAWQDTIVWPDVPKSGIKVVYIRATEGDGFTDPKLKENYLGAQSAGLKIGFYHFMTALNEAQARAQAAFFASTLYHGGYISDCRYALDFGGGGSLTDTALTSVALAFMEELEYLTNETPMLYTDAYGARARYGAALSKYPIWVANYGVREPEANGKWASWAGFQYSDRGRVDGISTNVDLDSFTKEVFVGLAPTPTPTVTPVPTPTPTPTPVPTPTPAPSVTPVTQYYQAQTGDTVLSIAARYNVTPQVILSDNAMIPVSGLVKGLVLRIKTAETPRIGAYASLYLPVSRTNFAFAAKHFYVSENALLAVNQQPFGRAVAAGQALKIPLRTGSGTAQSAPSGLLDNAYVTQLGDSAASVASVFGLTEDELRAYNGLSASDQIVAGQILRLTPYGVPSGQATFYGAYVVRRGDTLSAIARTFKTSVSAILKVNDIKEKNLLVIGQILILP